MNVRPKILITDDSKTNIKVLSSILSDQYEMFFTQESDKVLEIAKKQSVDLILLDIVMPGLNGYEVCALLKADNSTKNIPVVFVTSMGNVEDEEKGLSVGAIDYITKPFSAPIVKARVKNHIRLKMYQDQLEEMSQKDGLTGLYNKRHFNNVLETEWRRAIRDQHSLSIVLVDIDYFKRYNDNYGHLEGDKCLAQVAKAINKAVKRPGDIVARFGGEEFACILPGTGAGGALELAKNIRNDVSNLKIEHKHSDADKFVTVSLGVAGITRIPENMQSIEIIKKADDMLYKAKEKGRNQVCADKL